MKYIYFDYKYSIYVRTRSASSTRCTLVEANSSTRAFRSI